MPQRRSERARAHHIVSNLESCYPSRTQEIPTAHGIGQPRDSAVVVVEGAPPATPAEEPSPTSRHRTRCPMLGPVHACCPCDVVFVGMRAGPYAYENGIGPFGGIIVGFRRGWIALGRYAFSVALSPVLRLLIGLLFAVPAARAGYDAIFAFRTSAFPRNGGGRRSP